MGNLITFVNDNHVDNYLKEISVFVYYGSSVNNQPKNRHPSISVVDAEFRKEGQWTNFVRNKIY